MRQMDLDGLLMCRIQGRIFEKSLTINCSSLFFIKKYMYGIDAKNMDDLVFLNIAKSEEHIIDDMKVLSYGTIKFSNEELYWLGYMYRYISYTYEIDSTRLFKLIPGSKLLEYYNAYSQADPTYVINRIFTENNIIVEDDYLFKKTQNIITNKLNS